MARMSRKAPALAIVGALIVVLFYLSQRTVRENSAEVPGFSPLRDDARAAALAPRLLAPRGAEFGPEPADPEALYYRASRDEQGRIHIAYFFAWSYERNESSGFAPLMNRLLYTGGLSLQRVLFGPGDVEVVTVVLGPGGAVQQVEYEIPENYDPARFGVTHKTVQAPVDGGAPLYFRVASWNHLFERAAAPGPEDRVITLAPQYFSAELWDRYRMFKARETLLSRNRAHPLFAREAAAE